MAGTRLLLACVAVAVAVPAAAQAAPPQLPPQARVQGDMILVDPSVTVDKQATLDGIDAYVDAVLAPEVRKHRAEAQAQDRRSPLARRTAIRRPAIHGSAHLKGYNTKNYSCSYMYSKFDDTVSHPLAETSATVDGYSRTAWLGTCPYNAATVKLQDTICFDSIGFSVSFGGAGFSSTGGGCGAWTNSVSNNWQITHYYSGVHGSCFCAIYRIRQSSAATYKFGTTFVTVVANGSILI